MPGMHRNGDARFCGASTIVSLQSTVFTNGVLQAVQGDPNSHGDGQLVAQYGSLNVYVEGKLVIVAVGDTALTDDLFHPPGQTDPSTSSPNVFAYGS